MSHDFSFYNRLKEVISTSSDAADDILKMSTDLFIPALARFQYPSSPEDPNGHEQHHIPDEATCKQVLSFAVSAAKRMLTEKDYNISVFRLLACAGLQPYSFRLLQFESLCESFQDDPQSLIRQGMEIIETALTPSNDN